MCLSFVFAFVSAYVVVFVLQDDFESHGMTVVFASCDAKCRGSPCTRERIWPIVFDVEPEVAALLGLQRNFFAVHDELKAEPFTYDMCAISHDVLKLLCAPLAEGTDRKSTKKAKSAASDDTWPDVHEECFSFARVAWPPDTSLLKDFLPRESQIIFLADKLFPAEEGVWTFFDSNHSIERTLRWPPKVIAKTKKVQPLRNPWKTVAPTFTAGSKIVARKLHKVGDEPAFLEMKRVHPLEQMRMNGWDLSFWADGQSPFYVDQITAELVADMAGNMWNGWSFMAVEIATAECCDWSEAKRLTSEMREKKHQASKKAQQMKKQDDEADNGSVSNSGDEQEQVPEFEMMPDDAQTDDEA